MNNYKNKYTFCFLLYLILLNSKTFKYSDDRILVYSCCDEFYSHYIPIFIDTMLRADKLKKLDIEIGVNLNSLNEKEEKAIEFLKKKYNYSKILIKYNFFIKNSTGTFFNNIKVQTWSVRFISVPIIKNKYVYITDVDIITLVDNFYLYLINDMIKRKSCYSNIVRRNYNPKRMTGLHFFEYNRHYPLPKQKNYDINDEELLYNIVKSKGINIDFKTYYRPLFGIHISPHSPDGKKFGGNNLVSNWINYLKCDDFIFIYPLLDNFIINKLIMVNKIFQINYNFNIYKK